MHSVFAEKSGPDASPAEEALRGAASMDMGEVAEPQGRQPRGRRAWGQHQERYQAGCVVREKTFEGRELRTTHLGMPKELVSPDGLVVWSAAHAAFGKVIATEADPEARKRYGDRIQSPFRLLGQVADEDVGLNWTRFRCF